MYAKIYESFVRSYLRMYSANGAHTAAVWSLAALALVNSFSVLAVLGSGDGSWGSSLFELVKRTELAALLGIALLLLHYALFAGARRRVGSGSGDASIRLAPMWIGTAYTLSTVLLCFYVSKSLD